MLLRGVRLPVAALNSSDIEELKGKTRNSGRSYRGAPLGRHHNDGRRERMNYGPDSRRDGNNRQYANGGQRGGHNAFPGPPPMIPPGWAPPPPPGFPGFGNGLPPPPPAYHGGGRGGYGNGNYGGQPYTQRHAPPGVPPYQDYGGQYNGPPPRHQGQNRRPYDDGRGQRNGRGHGY